MNESFKREEKLKSKIILTKLFAEGKAITKFPIKLVYLPVSRTGITTNQTAVSVPKRNFKKAVDRIHLKRLMREAFRKNKYLVGNKPGTFAFMLLYIGRHKEDYHKIFSATEELLKKFADKDSN